MAESTIIRRRAWTVLAFLGCSAVAAFALAAGLREFLPYESFRRYTPEEQFLFWEGVVWMTGLGLLLFGVAGALGTLHLLRWWLPGQEEFIAGLRRPEPRTASLAPVWVLTTGIALILIALQARAQLPG